MTVTAGRDAPEPPAVDRPTPGPARHPEAIAAVRLAQRRATDAVTVAGRTVLDAFDAFAATEERARQPTTPVSPTEMLGMLSPGRGTHLRVLEATPYDPTCGDHRLEMKLHLLAGGTRVDALYAGTALDEQRLRAEIRPLRAAGARVRTLPTLPATVLIFDEVAFLVHPDNDRGGGPTRGVQALWPGPLHSAVDDLFQALWRRSAVVRDPHLGPEEPAPETVLLLRLLAEGLSDQKVAARLGISPRTLHRRLHRLMAVTGTTTRFQLGLQVARLGWLTTT
ncbi:helix-turn-helix domain-containing protein [Micromonospora sp. RP3T]|uniref:helix-turn-helix domain-containing protein n=1 Tax=Micromonospora sp. RP3T TaxID=2135446 RepID=UPI000D15829D|nr:helix-turn-helix domain-containing protein [Micromonospora sp. RP3T]PTA46516.1 hypothetical protein C8054_08995 [Micromonospora sp. RP3T]